MARSVWAVRLDGGILPPEIDSSRACTCYAAGGMRSLAFTQEDFLVKLYF